MTHFLTGVGRVFALCARRDGAVTPHLFVAVIVGGGYCWRCSRAWAENATVNVNVNGGRVSAAEMFEMILGCCSSGLPCRCSASGMARR